MKKKIVFGIVAVLVILLIAGILAWKFLMKPEPDPVQWGMTKEQVKNYEDTLSGTLKAESAGTLLYQSRLFKHVPVAVEYEFKSGKLFRRQYMPIEKEISSEESARNVQALRKQLNSRYRTPEVTTKDQAQVETWTTQEATIILRVWEANPWTLEYKQQ